MGRLQAADCLASQPGRNRRVVNGLLRTRYTLSVNSTIDSSVRPRPLDITADLRSAFGSDQLSQNPSLVSLFLRVYPFRGNRPVPGSAFADPRTETCQTSNFITPAEWSLIDAWLF